MSKKLKQFIKRLLNTTIIVLTIIVLYGNFFDWYQNDPGRWGFTTHCYTIIPILGDLIIGTGMIVILALVFFSIVNSYLQK